jgi:hypothetical protein
MASGSPMALILWPNASQTISSTSRWTCVRGPQGGCPGGASTNEAAPSHCTMPMPVTVASVSTAGRHARGGRTTARGPKAVNVHAALRAADQVFRQVKAPRNRTGAGQRGSVAAMDLVLEATAPLSCVRSPHELESRIRLASRQAAPAQRPGRRPSRAPRSPTPGSRC